MLYTAAPSTWPTGSKPVLRIAANSLVDSDEPQVPLRRISAIRAAATEGSPLLLPSATRAPFPAVRRLSTIPGGREPGSIAVLGVPFFVALAHLLQGPGRFLLSRVGAQPVFRRAAGFRFDGVMPEAVVPALLCVHAD